VIVLQKTVPVFEEDDAHTLAARILEQEHIAYSEGIARVISGEYRVVGRRYVRS
jgi:phosphoribosylglycinamide formyltransferase-1